MVRTDRRPQYRAPSLAVCRFGGEESAKGAELEHRGLGRYGSQDSTPNSDDEEQNSDSAAMEPCCLNTLLCYTEAFFFHVLDTCTLTRIRYREHVETVASQIPQLLRSRVLNNTTSLSLKFCHAGCLGHADE